MLVVKGGVRCVLVAVAVLGCKGEKPQQHDYTIEEDAGVAAVPSASASSVVKVRDPSLKIVDLGVSETFGCARYSDDSVWCAGNNAFGQLGRGTRGKILPDGSSPLEGPAPIADIAAARSLVVGAQGLAACVIAKDGQVYCWGNLAARAAGPFDGTLKPTPVPGLRDPASIAMSGTMYCALTKKGTVVCWGLNDQGQLGDGTKENRDEPIEIKGLAGAKQLAIGLRHGCALTAARTVKCWGDHGGPKGEAVAIDGFSNVDEIASGTSAICARSGGHVSCVGPFVSLPKPREVSEFDGATGLGAAATTLCALRKGSIACILFGIGDRAVKETKLVGRFPTIVGAEDVCVAGDAGGVQCSGSFRGRSAVEQL